MTKIKYCILILLFPWVIFSQERIVVDNEKNPISNVSAFNSLKTKSALSNSEGIINLSRFLLNDTIIFQHPSYKLKKTVKSRISEYIVMDLEYDLLKDIVIYETKNNNNIQNDAEKKIYISSVEILELNGNTPADLLEKKGGVAVYSTCSLSQNENWKIIERFLTLNEDFYIDNASNYIDSTYVDKNGCMSIFPPAHHTEGMFAARLVKK